MSLNPRKTVLLICDVQERFRSPIYGFEPLTASICKLVKASQVLGIPNFVTEQNPRALGPTVQEITTLLDKSPDQALNLGRISKTKFSMITDESWEDDIGLPRYKNFILTGIEITTSESLLYRLLGDADHPQYKYIAKLVKEEKQNTAEALQTLAAVL
ncbi:hypothetical protein B9479_004653 [Cryptococcus floricola]|uniref:Isochorismatase-like domain-containing protein n=1 Tax=Cryptococcus floricola TaxID=2591691 RepID=A0A5D3AXA5_9TREE|nr:hypothetical protein B9479_004653 [Cryptococcus floricola]